MSEFDPKPPAGSDAPEIPQATPGATGIFGVLTPRSPAEPGGGAAVSQAWPHPAASAPMLSPQLPARSALAPVVVHEVKFQAQDAEGSEAESSLQRLLQSLAPAIEAAPQTPGAGEFTQLLSALQIPAVAVPSQGEAAAAPQTAVPEHAAAMAQAAVPEPASSHVSQDAVSAEVAPYRGDAAEMDPSSFTRLFEALSSPATIPGEATGLGSRDAAASRAPQAEEKLAVAIPSEPGILDRKAAPAGPSWSSPPSGADPATFTQLFNALGSQPRPEPSQAGDYPPLAARKPLASFPAVPSSTLSASAWPSGAPSPLATPPSLPGAFPGASRSEGESDLSSLTQLLQALEFPEAHQAPPQAHPQPLPTSNPQGTGGPAHVSHGRDPRGSFASGATVAFTPPESVQRRAAQAPAAAPGPGDFTRVLQASALRESGLGSQAAGTQHPPAAPAASAPPVHGAAAPLPPWAAPPMPYMPHMSSLAHANSSVPGLGPAPGMHAPLQGPHLHLQSAFIPPIPSAQQPQDASRKPNFRGTLLPLILMAIIVILVGVLVAVLLRH